MERERAIADEEELWDEAHLATRPMMEDSMDTEAELSLPLSLDNEEEQSLALSPSATLLRVSPKARSPSPSGQHARSLSPTEDPMLEEWRSGGQRSRSFSPLGNPENTAECQCFHWKVDRMFEATDTPKEHHYFESPSASPSSRSPTLTPEMRDALPLSWVTYSPVTPVSREVRSSAVSSAGKTEPWKGPEEVDARELYDWIAQIQDQ
ncbi:hypothetical protein DFJ74DRAFT_160150 [Hyaloraphidium curvatum]|nr:hypothetical protein DFJ74DRAFT_160150 [Hyaloraphidium curvatum]